jgi:hypothetical protein
METATARFLEAHSLICRGFVMEEARAQGWRRRMSFLPRRKQRWGDCVGVVLDDPLRQGRVPAGQAAPPAATHNEVAGLRAVGRAPASQAARPGRVAVRPPREATHGRRCPESPEIDLGRSPSCWPTTNPLQPADARASIMASFAGSDFSVDAPATPSRRRACRSRSPLCTSAAGVWRA